MCCVKHRPKIYPTGVSGLGSGLCDHLKSQLTALNRTGSSRNDEFIGHSSCLPSSMPKGRHQPHWYAVSPLVAPTGLGTLLVPPL